MAKAPQIITPQEKLDALGEFEGRRLIGTGIEIPGAAGGLREALAIDPQIMQGDEVVTVLLECKVGKIRHDPVYDDINDVHLWRRVHVLNTTAAMIVPREFVQGYLDEQATKVAEARGVPKLDFSGDDDDPATALLVEEHEGGFHGDGLIEACPLCQEERDATEKEAE